MVRGAGDFGAEGRQPSGEDGEFFEERGENGEGGDYDGEGEFDVHCTRGREEKGDTLVWWRR